MNANPHYPRLYSTLRAALVALLTGTVILASGCAQNEPAAEPPPVVEASASPGHSDKLAQILGAQPEAAQARYAFRNPQQTLEFFGIEPGMTVVEALPGGGWYSKVLLPYLGNQGSLVGVNYPMELWPNFSFVNDEFLENMKTWTTDWPTGAQEWRDDTSAPVSAFLFGSMPAEASGSADAVLFIRALHNLARFDEAFLKQAIADSYSVLKPGGIVGVVQHEARPNMTDEWANGANGYLKRQFVIDAMTAGGFEYVAASSINENAKDQPTDKDYVWRLPPSLNAPDEAKEALRAVGESNRMTLKFRKPSA